MFKKIKRTITLAMITLGVIGGGYFGAYDIINETIEAIVPSATVSEPNENMEATVPPTTKGEEIDNVENVEEDVPKLIGKNNSAWGKIIGCTHTPHKYNKKENVIKCECQANKFSGQEMADLNYHQFVSSYIKQSDIRFKNSEEKKAFYVESFLKFKGIDPAFIQILDNIKQHNPGYKLDDARSKIVELTAVVEMMGDVLKADAFYAEAVDDINMLRLIGSAGEANELLAKSLKITEFTIILSDMINNTGDIEKGCTQFLQAVKTVSGDFVGFSMMIDVLQQSLDMYWNGVENYARHINITSLGLMNGGTVFGKPSWSDFVRREYWDRLTYNHIMGIKKGDKDGRELLLPSLPEILKEYGTMSDEEKVLASEYILFCLDRAFEEAIGFTYQEYVQCLGE